MSCVEIHFHLLPGVDDGPARLSDSVELAAAAAAEGTRTIVATPHVNACHNRDVGALPDRVREVLAALRRGSVPVDVVCGAEVSVDRVATLSYGELELVAHGPAGRRWVLLEAPLEGLDGTYTEAADELRARGFAVVIAHPERTLFDPDAGWRALEHELAAGSGVQVNAWSVAGCYGERIRQDAMRVLARAPAAAIASDAHGPSRMPALGLAVEALACAGDTRATERVGAIPRRLLEAGLAPRRVVAA